eukprot:3799790-Amphidinium_carterae.1
MPTSIAQDTSGDRAKPMRRRRLEASRSDRARPASSRNWALVVSTARTTWNEISKGMVSWDTS